MIRNRAEVVLLQMLQNRIKTLMFKFTELNVDSVQLMVVLEIGASADGFLFMHGDLQHL